mmetsp:Transcript_45833/g.106523  ORF Transcript_45833/g.106523 Transcript_45833/m.106523 type:complete len:530 (+) Transcript_45833:134-1723(+)
MPSLALSTGAAQQQAKVHDIEVRSGLAKGRAVWSLAPGADRPGGVWSDNAAIKMKSQARSRSGTPRPPVLSPGSWLARTGRDGKGDGADKYEEGYATPTYNSPRGDLDTTSRTPPQSYSLAPLWAVPRMDLNDYTSRFDALSSSQNEIMSKPNAVRMDMKDQAVLQEEADVASDVLLPMPNAAKAGGTVSGAATSAPSAGSAGHPYNCAAACRYVKRKGGCRDGANCPNCHLCFWKRADGNLTKDATATEASTTDAMPSDMGELICSPCVPIEDAPGLAAFNSSTLEALTGPFNNMKCQLAPPPGLSLDGESEASTTDLNLVVSYGSVGHPHKCALPCKYFGKSRGCKDGKNCMRCHICVWRHTDAKRASDEDGSDEEEEEEDVPPPPMPFSEAATDEALKNPSEAAFFLPAPSMVAVDLKESQARCDPAEPELLSLEVPMKIVTEPPNENWSLGSIGHPTACAQACKYRYRKGGCRDGRQCLCCHQCRWSRHTPMKPVPQGFGDYYPGLEFLAAEQAVAPMGGAAVGQ